MTVTIVRNASVLDPASATRAEGQSVAVENGRITDVGPRLTGPGDAVIVDAGNQTVMPGLIDAHTHPAIVDEDVFGMAEWPPSYVAARAGRVLRGMLMRGFTSIRDVGGGDHGLARAVDEGYFDGPRMFYGGKQLSQTGGAGDWRAPSRVVYDRHYYTPAIGVICDGVAEVRRAVREEVRRGAHHIKVYLSGAVDSPSDRVDSTQFSMEELRRDRRGGDGRQHLRGRPRLHLAGHQPRSARGRAQHRAREPDGRQQHPAVQGVRRLLRPDDRHLPDARRAGAGRAAAGGHRSEARPCHRRRARRARDGAQGRPAHRLRHRPVRRHPRSAAAGIHHPVRDPAARRPDQGGHDHRRAAAAARGRARGDRPRRAGRPARHRREPAGRHPGADDSQHDAEAHHEGRQDRQKRAAYVVTSRRRLPAASCRRPSGRRRARARSASRPG